MASIVEPVVSTLVAGIEAYARRDRIRFSHASVLTSNFSDLKSKLRRGDMFIYVGVASSARVPWRDLKDQGVFRVYYQTEPFHTCAMWDDSVDELWDFSWHNIEACHKQRFRQDV